MYSKIFLNLILIIFLVICQLSFIGGLPWLFNKLNLILIVLIFILGLKDLKTALWWSIGVGFLFDVYSFSPFGFYLISLLFTVLVINFLLTSFLTDRSLYSFLALTFFATIFYEFFLNLIIYMGNFFIARTNFFILTREFWANISVQIILNLLTVFILFYVVSFLSQRLKPVFLIRKRS